MLQDEQTLRRTVAKNIAAYRKSHKDTQLDLARKLNYSDKSVSKWEQGYAVPSSDNVLELSKPVSYTHLTLPTIA